MQISFIYIYIYIYFWICAQKSDFNYGFKLELITTSHQKFIVKMLWT